MKFMFSTWYVTSPFHPSCFRYPNNVRSKAQTMKLPCHVTCYILLLHHPSYAQVHSAMVKLYSKWQHRRTNTGEEIHELIWASLQKSWHCTYMGSFWYNITTKHPKQNTLLTDWCSKMNINQVIVVEPLSYLIVPQFPNYGLMQ
jgi:hypothetical protein